MAKTNHIHYLLVRVFAIAVAVLVAIIWSWLGRIDDKLDKSAQANLTEDEGVAAVLVDYVDITLCQGKGGENCVPDLFKQEKNPVVQLILILNGVIIMLIGGIGNLLTLISIPYVYFKYRESFMFCWNDTTLLMLHLSLCDLLYVLIGVPSFLVIYIYQYFPGTAYQCTVLATVRNLIAYADFLTLASIASTRCVGLTRQLMRFSHRRENSVSLVVLNCLCIWALAFAVISPMVFHIKIGDVDFGQFGYSSKYGMCNCIPSLLSEVMKNEGSEHIGPGIVYTIGFSGPFLAINISHIILTLSVRRFIQGPSKPSNPDHTTQHSIESSSEMESLSVTMDDKWRNMTKILTTLSISYVIFSGLILPVEWMDKLNLSYEGETAYTVIGYAIYMWIYAINVIVYVATSQEFRKMYLLFLADLRTGLGRLLCGQSPRDRSTGQPDIVRQTDLANTATGGKKISPASLRRNFRRRYGCYTISGNLPRDEEKNPRRSEEDKLSSASVPTLVSYISTSPAVTPTSPLEPGTTFGNARPFSYTTDLYRSVSYTNNSFNPDSEPVLLIAVPEPI